MNPVDELVSRTRTLASAYHRLLLVVGPAGSGKTAVLRAAAEREGWPILNLSLELARRLQELPARSRSRKVTEFADEAVKEAGAETVALDHIELAFDPDLQQDPLRLLQHLSRTRTIVAAWPGTCAKEQLTYAEPGHREYRSYSKPEVEVLPLHDPSARHEPETDVSP